MADISKHTKISLDDQPLPFGKYKGKTPNEVLEIDPQYLVWFYENVDGEYITKKTYKYAIIADSELDQEFYEAFKADIDFLNHRWYDKDYDL